jgi:hypothetical protein
VAQKDAVSVMAYHDVAATRCGVQAATPVMAYRKAAIARCEIQVATRVEVCRDLVTARRGMPVSIPVAIYCNVERREVQVAARRIMYGTRHVDAGGG